MEVFNLIFQQTDPVFSIWQNFFTDVVYSKSQSLLDKIKEFRKNEKYFTAIYDKILADNDSDEAQRKRVKLSDISDPQQHTNTFFSKF